MSKCPTSFIIYYALLFLFLSSLRCFILCSLRKWPLLLFCSTQYLLIYLKSLSSFYFFIQLIIVSEWLLLITFSFLLHNIVFILTFWVITHNSHPQLMVLSWVKVHITQGWVRSKTKSVFALATLNLCFWPKLRCTCPTKNHGQHIYTQGRWVGEIKERFLIGSTYFDQKGITISSGSFYFRIDVC